MMYYPSGIIACMYHIRSLKQAATIGLTCLLNMGICRDLDSTYLRASSKNHSIRYFIKRIIYYIYTHNNDWNCIL